MSAITEYRAAPYRRVSVPATAHPLVRELFEIMHQERMGVVATAERAGVCKNTLQGWRTKHPPTVHLLEACLNGLGYKLAIVASDEDISNEGHTVPLKWGLTRRQTELAELLITAHGRRLLIETICSRLDMTPGTLKVTYFHINQKIRAHGWQIAIASPWVSLFETRGK